MFVPTAYKLSKSAFKRKDRGRRKWLAGFFSDQGKIGFKWWLGLLVVVGISGVLSLVVGYRLIKGGRWDGISQFNMAVINQTNGEVGLISYSPEKDMVVVWWFGNEVLLPTVRGYGEYRIGVIEKLGEQEHLSTSLLVESLEQWLSTPMLGVVKIKPQKLDLTNVSAWTWWIMTAPRSGLAMGDRIKFAWRVRSERRATANDFRQLELEVKQGVGGGKEVRLGQKTLTELITSLKDPLITKTNEFDVAVINATNHTGLARLSAQKLTNMGYDVVSVIDGEAEEKETSLLVDSVGGGWDPLWWPIRKLFGGKLMERENVESEFRAKAVLIVGEDYYRLLEGNQN